MALKCQVLGFDAHPNIRPGGWGVRVLCENLCDGYLCCADARVDLLAVHPDSLWSLDTYPNLVALHAQDGHRDVIPDPQ